MQSLTNHGRWVTGTTLAAAIMLSGGATSAYDTNIAGPRLNVNVISQNAPYRLPGQEPDRVPLLSNLGTVSFGITTTDPRAQAYFDQGLRLAYGFDHAEALRSFREAQRIDPGCAMCYWGEALVLGPNTSASMKASALVPAVAAIAKAQVRVAHATPREQALIAALSRRYSTDPGAVRTELDIAYADAMASVRALFPNDDDIAVFYAEALMNLSPWDDREASGETSEGRHAEVIETLETVLARNPDHPAAIHLHNHAVEDSMAVNLDTAAADEAYVASTDPTGIYPAGFYPHNIHFIVVSAQMIGAADIAFEAAQRLTGTISDDVAREIAWLQVIKALPYFVQAQYGDIESLREIPNPGTELPFVRAMWHFARAVAFADLGWIGDAEAERSALADIGAANEFRGMLNGDVPAPKMLRIAYHVITARMAMSQGDYDTAIAQYRAAAAVQDTFPNMEPPYWYVPLRQSLGGALLAAGRSGEAEAAFSAALEETPNNGWALFGLSEALRHQGRLIHGLTAAKALDRVWLGSREALALYRL